MDSTVDIRHWLEPKQAALAMRKAKATVIRMVGDGRLKAVVYAGGLKRRRMKIDPASVDRYRLGGKN